MVVQISNTIAPLSLFDHNYFFSSMFNFQLFQLLGHRYFSFVFSCSKGGIYKSHIFKCYSSLYKYICCQNGNIENHRNYKMIYLMKYFLYNIMNSQLLGIFLMCTCKQTW